MNEKTVLQHTEYESIKMTSPCRNHSAITIYNKGGGHCGGNRRGGESLSKNKQHHETMI